MYLKDPKTKEPSVTLTLFVIGFLVALAKLAVAGITIKSFTAAPFSGVDFAAVVAALGGIYAMRRTQGKSNEN